MHHSLTKGLIDHVVGSRCCVYTPTCAELCQPLLPHMYECMSVTHQLLSNLYNVKTAVVAIATDPYLPQQRLRHHLQLKIMNCKRSKTA